MIQNFLPSIQKAIDFIDAGLKKGTWHDGNRLPSLKQLAILSGVSVFTMWKAVDQLKKRGVLSARRGGFITVGTGLNQKNPSIHKHTLLWQKMRSILEADILNGVYGFGETLPRLSQLSARYGLCFVTLKKVLHALAEDGTIIPFKKTYRIPIVRRGRFQNTIMLISEEKAPGKKDIFRQFMQQHKMQQLVSTLEGECAQLKVMVDFLGYDMFSSLAVQKTHAMLSGNDAVIGFVVNLWWTVIPDLQQTFLDLLSILAKFKKPVAVLDHIGACSLPDPLHQNNLFKIFRPVNYSAGTGIGRYLMTLGHRHIAYISLNHEAADWSVERFSGIQRLYDKEGYSSSLISRQVAMVTGTYELVLALCNFDRKIFERVFGEGVPAQYLKDFVRRYENIKPMRKEILGLFDKKSLSEMQEQLAILKDLAEKKVKPEVMIEVRQSLYDTIEQRLADLYQVPLFEEALARRNITAWVCANDAIAFSALRFLEKKGKKIPADISLAGFDNVPATFELSLTSYDFNMGAMTHQMLAFIQHPEGALFKKAAEIINVEGRVIERRSTGRPAKIKE
jgi:DNA-binding LacI/PurR family transcriptional regulator/DNA-binding transcriptional regulator YhcF (GntR family)